ncbi:TrbG/VirB9 family P-type conjugative transfer protein [Muricoccus pecuniae]|uniref:Type IV secretion system protein VirB9 n=1 Tax=Muricoccus pecuniae TaxID=693023 RepID=A0A840YBB5_9PROT|nr:TrbG/VirB9 family P-type conjugative transfer protein [Roseomonas pecuniae]MBB5695999.1 type IV secretion system protein VirB9 [Roseomonas pecuniae]
MNRPRSVLRLLLAPSVALPLAWGAPATAGEAPAPAGADPRVRVIAYNPQQVVKLYAVPGATLTIQLAPGETVAGLPVSDQSLLDTPEPAGPGNGPIALAGGPVTPSERAGAGRGASTDRNLFTAVRGNFVMLKPLRDLAPQPLFIIGRSTDPTTGKEVMRAYTFELSTREGPLTADAPDTYYLVRFTYPAEERAAAAAAAAARRQAANAAAETRRRELADRQARERLVLASTNAATPGVLNWNYDGQGDRDLAPAEVWDDGQSTFLRFPGNRRVPAIFSVLADGREAAVNYSANTSGLITIHQTNGTFRLRDGGLVLCILNRAFDATGRNPGTGTTSPDVVREIRQ